MNPHEVLGVSSEASDEDIKKAYKKLALEWHPDRHGGSKDAEEKFKEINAAYQALTNKQKGGFSSPPEGFEDLFNFGPFAHQMVNLTMRISFEDAFVGGRKTIEFSSRKQCQECHGIGKATSENACTQCGGSGRVSMGGTAVFSIFRECHICRGSGKQLGGKCVKCGGLGANISHHKTAVDIPPGVMNGEVVLSVDGFPICVCLDDHPVFRIVRGTPNVESNVEVNLFDLILGGETIVPTLSGEKRIKIDQGLQPGSCLRIKGAGMPDRRGGKGDHMVRILAKMPKLTADQQQTLMKMRVEIEGASDGSAHA